MTKNIKYFITYLMAFFLGSLLLGYFNYMVSQTEQMYIANRLYSNWSVPLEEQKWHELDNVIFKNNRIFIEHNRLGTIRTLYSQDNWSPPLIQGRMFTEGEIGLKAVVGQEILNQLDEGILLLHNMEFEVIGVLGAAFPSFLDQMALLNTLPDQLPIYNIVIDSVHSHYQRELREEVGMTNESGHLFDDAMEENHIFTRAITVSIKIITTLLSIILGSGYFIFHHSSFNVNIFLGKEQDRLIRRELAKLSFLLFFGSGTVLLINPPLIIENWGYLGFLWLISLASFLGMYTNYNRKGMMKG